MLFRDHCQQRFGLTRLPSSSSNVQLQTMPFRFDNFATDVVPLIVAPLAAAHEEAVGTTWTEINLTIGEREASRTPPHCGAFSRNDDRRVEHQVLDSRTPQVDLIAVATSSLGRDLKSYAVSDLHHPISMT